MYRSVQEKKLYSVQDKRIRKGIEQCTEVYKTREQEKEFYRIKEQEKGVKYLSMEIFSKWMFPCRQHIVVNTTQREYIN